MAVFESANSFIQALGGRALRWDWKFHVAWRPLKALVGDQGSDRLSQVTLAETKQLQNSCGYKADIVLLVIKEAIPAKGFFGPFHTLLHRKLKQARTPPSDASAKSAATTG